MVATKPFLLQLAKGSGSDEATSLATSDIGLPPELTIPMVKASIHAAVISLSIISALREQSILGVYYGCC